jgi:hypothetical protein
MTQEIQMENALMCEGFRKILEEKINALLEDVSTNG